MSAVSISSIISSLIGFWQKLGVATDSYPLNLPQGLIDFMNAAKKLFTYLLSLIPSFPDFDERGILVLTSFGLPLIIDLIFCWFMLHFWESVIHILDIIATVCCFYGLGTLILSTRDTTTLILFLAGLLFLITHILFTLVCRRRKKKKRYTLEQMIHEVKHHFLCGVIPGVQSRISFEALNQHLHSYCSHIVLISKTPKKHILFVFIIVGIVLFVISLLCTGVAGDAVSIPASIQIFVPPFGFVFAVCFFVVGVMKATQC